VSRLGGVLAAYWLLVANVVVTVFVGLPFAAPALLAAGHADAANVIYTAYRSVCHQWAFRSYFLFGPQWTYALEELGEVVGPESVFSFLGGPDLGYKVAFCERDVAIYLAVLAAGLAYAALGPRLPPLGLGAYTALITPMALDGFSQLFGWRESTPELRTVTGALFGLASVWLVYPRIDRVLAARGSECSLRAGQTASGTGR
jgi:uncharacterized membrane protein